MVAYVLITRAQALLDFIPNFMEHQCAKALCDQPRWHLAQGLVERTAWPADPRTVCIALAWHGMAALNRPCLATPLATCAKILLMSVHEPAVLVRCPPCSEWCLAAVGCWRLVLQVVACWMSSHSWIVKSRATVTTSQQQQPSGNSSGSRFHRNAREGCKVPQYGSCLVCKALSAVQVLLYVFRCVVCSAVCAT
jgi:hypothetical protein